MPGELLEGGGERGQKWAETDLVWRSQDLDVKCLSQLDLPSDRPLSSPTGLPLLCLKIDEWRLGVAEAVGLLLVLGCIVRPCLKPKTKNQKRFGVVAHTLSPNTWEAKAGGSL